MSNGADQRCFAGKGCPRDHLSVEHPQILPAAAAAGHDDHICPAAAVQRPDGRREFTVLDDNNIADNFVGECYSAGQATPKEALDNMMQYDFFEKKS